MGALPARANHLPMNSARFAHSRTSSLALLMILDSALAHRASAWTSVVCIVSTLRMPPNSSASRVNGTSARALVTIRPLARGSFSSQTGRDVRVSRGNASRTWAGRTKARIRNDSSIDRREASALLRSLLREPLLVVFEPANQGDVLRKPPMFFEQLLPFGAEPLVLATGRKV